MYSLNVLLGLPYPTLLHPLGRPPLKWLYGRFRDGLLAGQAACGRLPLLWTPPHHAPTPTHLYLLRLCFFCLSFLSVFYTSASFTSASFTSAPFKSASFTSASLNLCLQVISKMGYQWQGQHVKRVNKNRNIKSSKGNFGIMFWL